MNISIGIVWIIWRVFCRTRLICLSRHFHDNDTRVGMSTGSSHCRWREFSASISIASIRCGYDRNTDNFLVCGSFWTLTFFSSPREYWRGSVRRKSRIPQIYRTLSCVIIRTATNRNRFPINYIDRVDRRIAVPQVGFGMRIFMSSKATPEHKSADAEESNNQDEHKNSHGAGRAVAEILENTSEIPESCAPPTEPVPVGEVLSITAPSCAVIHISYFSSISLRQ